MARVQEFVIQECDIVQDWAKYLISDNETVYRFNSNDPKVKYVSSVFEKLPEQWGLRGNPYRWEELKQSFPDVV